MAVKITRKMNAYTFHFNNGSVTIDLDTPGEPIIGISGKALKSRPKNVDSYAFGSAILDAYIKNTPFTGYERELVDRLISLEVEASQIDIAFRSCNYSNHDVVTDKTLWKEYVKYIKSMDCHSINDFKCHRFYEMLSNKYHLNESERKMLRDCFGDGINITENEMMVFRETIKEYNNNMELRERVEQFLENNPEYNPIVCINKSNLDINYLYNKNWEMFREYEKILRRYNLKDGSGSLAKKYAYAKKIEKEYSRRTTDEIFNLSQSAYNLAYENDKIIVEVPYTRKECIAIGTEFNNCVGGYEWNKFLSKGARKVVVIRSKVNRNVKVCCDINDFGEICQYLAPYNRGIENATMKNFREEYQQYLDSIFRK